MRLLFVLLLLPVLLPADAAAEEAAAQAFMPCRACHSLNPAERGLPGPNLAGVIGRAVGGNDDFNYSPVLRKARDEGLRARRRAGREHRENGGRKTGGKRDPSREPHGTSSILALAPVRVAAPAGREGASV